jgi:hypothetical protein
MRRLLFVLLAAVVAVPLSIALAFVSAGAFFGRGLGPTPGALVVSLLFRGDPNILQIMVMVDSCFWFAVIVGTAMLLRARWVRKNRAGR